MKTPTLDQLRHYAVARSLVTPTTLPKAIARLGFVQADPLRAPARAQDLTLRHRVKDYRAGDLERRYPQLGIEEDFFINYGFMPAALHHLMHPRTPEKVWPAARWAQAEAVLAFVREHGVVHTRQVDAHFNHGKVRNWFGGSSNASTELLDGMHFRGLIRIAGRDSGIRLYAPRDTLGAQGVAPPRAGSSDRPRRDGPADAQGAHAAFDAMLDVVVAKYAPLPSASLGQLASRIVYGVPQWSGLRTAALQRARQRLPQAVVAGHTWTWPEGENPASRRHAPPEAVRLLAPFDPVVWDRRRFELLWGWAYRFEAYTPKAKRLRGHYALPLLWRDQVIGWGNLAVQGGVLQADIGYVSGKAPREAGYAAALDTDLQRMQTFLGLSR